MIDVAPYSNGRKAFTGTIFIDQRKNIPLEVRLTPNRAVNLPFDAKLTYRQSFVEVEGLLSPKPSLFNRHS
ncbi:MAG: hypothetical protein IPF79_05630 [Ignavibacteria bacterium]|nr:hypothetical protein [Ignavibacteria bacterium]